jgi:hypothetical protein
MQVSNYLAFATNAISINIRRLLSALHPALGDLKIPSRIFIRLTISGASDEDPAICPRCYRVHETGDAT